MAKRILIFSMSYHPFVGGAEVAVREITDRIPSSDIEFHLVTNRYDSTLPKVERIGNVLVHRIGFSKKHPSAGELRTFPLHLNKLLYQFLAYRTAVRLHRRYAYDGIWAVMAHSAGVPAGRFKKRFPDVPYLLTLQEGDPPGQIERTMRPFGRAFTDAFTRADYLQAISTFLLQWGKRQGFCGEGVVIQNGVDVAHFSRRFLEGEIAKARTVLGKKDGDIYLVTTSRLVRKNAIDDVIRAMPLLPPHVHFAVYGKGPEEAALKALAGNCGVSKRVHFLGHLGHDAIPLALKVCDVFIRPSRSEGMGNSFIEAFAAGLPVIATQVGGIVDFLFDSERNPDTPATGFAVDPDSPEQITEKVAYLIAHPDIAAEVAARARALAIDRYDWTLIARRMKTELFDRMLR